MRTRAVSEITNLTTDQKWHMVYNDELMKWKDEKAGEETRKQIETGQSGAIAPETPGWYIQKFLDKTITPKQVGTLLVSLRSKAVG